MTFFRFCAAAWVLAFHLPDLELPAPLTHLVHNGAYAMSFFFILSGAVLTYGYWDLASSPDEANRFYLARLARIYPLYALIHAVSVGWIPVPLSDWRHWAYVNATSLLCVQAWFPRAIMGVNAGTWSVSCEAFFYVLFPFLLPLARGWAERKSLPRAAFYLCLFIGFLGLADFTLSEPPFVFGYFSPLFRLPEFVLGMAIGAAVLQRRHGPPMRLHWVIVAAATVLLASCNTAYRFGLWIRANLIVVPAIGWLIYAAGCYEVSRPIALNGRCWRALQYLGQISYALFLVQLPVLLWTRGASPDSAIAILSKTSPRMTCAGFVCAILLLSVLGHEFVEKPARQFLLRRGAVRNS